MTRSKSGGSVRVAREAPPRGTYSLGAVSRLTRLSPHVLRAWERRYGAVAPLRTRGGTRRYRDADVSRLQLLRAAVEAGERIGEVAHLSDAELRRRVEALRGSPPLPLGPLRAAIERLDTDEVERLLARQLAGLGAAAFAEQVLAPLLRELGERWERGQPCVAEEHLVSALARNVLGAALRRRPGSASPPLVFATPPGERHELGLLAAAVAAADAGAPVVYLGPELPAPELAAACRRLRAEAVVLGVSRLPRREAEHALRELRRALPRTLPIWVAGNGSRALRLPANSERVRDLAALERRAGLLAARAVSRPGRSQEVS